MFWGLPDPSPLVRETDPDPSLSSKNSNKNTDSFCHFCDFCMTFLSMKNVPSKNNKQKKLKVNDENSRIRIRNRSKCARYCEIIRNFYNFRDIKNLVIFTKM
jgi:hypothetical protein